MNNSIKHTKGLPWSIKLVFILSLIVLALTLSACNRESQQQDKGSISKDTLSAPLPEALLALVLNETNLVVEVVVDGGAPQICNNLKVDQVKKTYSCSITLLSGPHSLKLIHSIIDDSYGTVRVTAVSGITVEIVPGQSTLADFSGSTVSDYDDDSDGITNLDELNAGTDPFTGMPDTPTATVDPVALAIINGVTPIVIVFDRAMDTTTLLLSGSMIHDGGVWNSNNDTLTINPQTRWAEGEQTLSLNAQSSVGTELGLTTLNYTVDDTPPTATSNPASGASIQNSLPITISFSESIDTDLFTASGILWNESDQGVWSNNLNTNDTLAITPNTTWVDGLKVLIIDAHDLAGNLLTKSFEYTVDATMPVASMEPLDGGVLMQDTSIVITFTESMNTASFNASGSLWNESNKVGWSSNGDIYTLSPTTVWSLTDLSQFQTLTFDITDLFGNPIATQNLTYTVGCPIGLSNCAGSCVDTSADINHCGACGAACNAANASSSCSSGSCNISSCNAGFENCNNSYTDGCEVTLASDGNNCGACGAVCNRANASSKCSSGNCNISICSTGFGNCNAIDADGCEVTLASNANNCGSCGVSCTDSVACTNDTCSNSQCGNTPIDSRCNAIVSDGTCGGFTSTCDQTGTFTRTTTPRACSLTGCISGTPFTTTLSCTRNTDTISCGTIPTEPRFCTNGVCL
ncbi:MAG: hypothetical protein ACC707_02135 [Thiohalomonadales bacterium]